MESLAEKLANLLDRLDDYEVFIDPDGSDFRILNWDTVAGILRNYGGKWKECNFCNGSVDPSVTVKFPDGSKLYVMNPSQAVYTREYLVSNE